MNESCPNAKARNIQASLPRPFSFAFITRQAFAVLVVFGLLGCNKEDQKPQKRTPRPEGGDDPVFAVGFPRLPAVPPVTSRRRPPIQPAGNDPV
jgi:hypothetical protein